MYDPLVRVSSVDAVFHILFEIKLVNHLNSMKLTLKVESDVLNPMKKFLKL